MTDRGQKPGKQKAVSNGTVRATGTGALNKQRPKKGKERQTERQRKAKRKVGEVEDGATSPGVEGQIGLRLQFNSRQSSTVHTIFPFSARHFEHSTEYSTYIPCRQTAIGWPTVDSGACGAAVEAPGKER
eukprot:1191628-Prorocentrum_minimum.AAC.2